MTPERVCHRCCNPFEPDRILTARTRYCRQCATQLRRQRVKDWKRQQIAELGGRRFFAEYAPCPQQRRDYMRSYMRKRRAQMRAKAGSPKQTV